MLGLQDKAWSPYAAGILIGLLQVPAFLLVDTALGASSSFVTASGYLAGLADPAVQENAYFDKYMTGSKYFWQSALVIGIALGALVSSRLGGLRRGAMSPVWNKAFGVSSFGQRFGMGFAGGFILLFGARLAGGCTSGHGISGLAQLAVGSTVAVVCFFIGGIIAARLLTKPV